MQIKDNDGGAFDFEALVKEAGEAVVRVMPSTPWRCRFHLHAWSRWDETGVGQARHCLSCHRSQRRLDKDLNVCAHEWGKIIETTFIRTNGSYVGEGHTQRCVNCGVARITYSRVPKDF